MPHQAMPIEAPWLHHLNVFAWILSNLLIGYIAIVLLVFVIGYAILFDPRATTGGRLIFRFAVSLIGVMGLVFISVFVDPKTNQQWYQYPGDIVWWRPAIRLIGYLYVAFTVTSLTVFLAVRKFAPHVILTAPDEQTLVRVRKNKK